MSKIAVVTDSTTYMPPELAKKHNISVAPQVLIWGDQTYKDGVDIQSGEFFTRLKTAKVMPTTSQVAVVSFQEIFQDLVNKDFEVLAVLVSSKLSGTVQSAVQAKELMGPAGDKINIVDSQSVAMALGFQAIAVARAIEAGASLNEAIALAEKSHEYTGVFFAVDTLEFLHRGGRIGGAQRFIGSALNLKPILAIQDGRVEGIERIRTKSTTVSWSYALKKSIADRRYGLLACMQMQQTMRRRYLSKQSRHSNRSRAFLQKSAPRSAHTQDPALWVLPSWRECELHYP